MKRFRIAVFSLMVVLIAGMLVASVSVAGADCEKAGHMKHMQCRCERHHHNMFHKLGLSADQKTKVIAIIKKYHDEKKADMMAVLDARENLSKVIHSDTYNEGAVKEAFGKVSAAQEKMVLLRAKISSEVSTVLTAEQKTKLQGLISKRFKKIRERIESGKGYMDKHRGHGEKDKS